MRDPADEYDDYLEDQEQGRVDALDKSVALAEQAAPDELLELKASITKTQFLDVLTERAIKRMFGRYGNETLEHNIRKHIHAVVEQQARDLVKDVVSEEIGSATKRILAEGFQTTDSYGNPRGERKTVAGFVLEYLQAKESHYNSKGNRLYDMGHKLVEDYLAKELEPHLKQLKQRCMEALDTSVTGKIREAIISGLGLRA